MRGSGYRTLSGYASRCENDSARFSGPTLSSTMHDTSCCVRYFSLGSRANQASQLVTFEFDAGWCFGCVVI
eukprot:9483054-Pyramimonas_sp.AAC.1